MSHMLRLASALCGATLFAAGHAPAANVAASPSVPKYGQAIELNVGNAGGIYMPATRFARSGNVINIEYEYLNDGFGPTRPDFGVAPVAIGELAPGAYVVNARLYDMARPQAAPQVTTSTLTVQPPDEWGIFMVPTQPLAFQSVEILVRSAAYFYPGSMRATALYNGIRVDFDYDGEKPFVAGATPPQGMVTIATLRIPGLAPGGYRVEGWGREIKSGQSERYFERVVNVGTAVPIVEYYAPSLDHYFVSAWPDEIAKLDGAPNLGWMRTGQVFKAWLRQGDGPYGAVPVCRFYASGPNSHFYTGDAAECQYLKSLEQKGRAEAAARGAAFQGWQYESVAFYALLPQGGMCPGGTQPVYRAYNMRATDNDSNHRFTVTPRMREAMKVSWAEEGVAFCAPL